MQAEIDRLRENGIYATAVFSVEGIYYHPEIQRRVAERHAITTGEKAEKCLTEAKSAAIAAISPHVQRLSERVAEKLVRERFFAHLPKKEQIAAATPLSITIDVPAIVAEDRARLQKALDAGDLTTIIARYPIRETPALSETVRKLGFQDRDQYEGAVRKLLLDEADALAFVRSLFGTLATDIAAGTNKSGTGVADTATPVAA